MKASKEKESRYLQYLPSIFKAEPFLGRFLLAFEEILTGLEEVETESSLEETIAKVAKLFNPSEIGDFFHHESEQQASLKEFVQWLSGWAAFRGRADWTLEQQQAFLANIIPLYRYRGTKANLKQLLTIYTGGLEAVITEPEDQPFQIRVNSTIGVTSQIGGAIPHYFKVAVEIPTVDLETLWRQNEIISSLIDLQKPAHTDYDLKILFPSMRIGIRSTIGEDTVLGDALFRTMQIGLRSTIGKDTFLESISSVSA